ncbi:MAG: sulfotransferase [Anaerolineae bacterium]
MALTETISQSMILADKGWRRYLPESKYKRPVSLWLNRRSAEINPYNGEAAHRLGLMHAEDEKWEDAICAYKGAISKGYRCKHIEHHLGLALVKLRRFAEAETAFHSALKIDPKAYWSYLELGNMLIKIGRYEEAMAIFELGLAFSPQQKYLRNRFFMAENALQQNEKVNQVKKQCLSGTVDEWTWKILTSASYLPYSATEENLEQVKQYLSRNPNSFGANRSMGWFLSYLDQPDEAMGFFRKAGKLKAEEMVQNHQLSSAQIAGNKQLDPTYFILGPHKAGTSSLHDWLCRHPQVVSGLEKEVRYWGNYHQFDLAWYQAHFLPIEENSGIVTGDATPDTLYYPALAQRLKAAYPNIKLIILLRDPVARAYSHYWMVKNQLAEVRSWEEVVEDVLASFPSAPLALSDLENHGFDYLSSSCLLPYIKAWLEVFPADQLLFVKSDQLFSAPAETVDQILAFIGLPTLSNPNGDEVELPHRNKGSYKNEMSADTLARLKVWFEPHDKALTEFLNANAPNVIGDL